MVTTELCAFLWAFRRLVNWSKRYFISPWLSVHQTSANTLSLMSMIYVKNASVHRDLRGVRPWVPFEKRDLVSHMVS